MGRPTVLYQKLPIKTLTQFLIITFFYNFVKKMNKNYKERKKAPARLSRCEVLLFYSSQMASFSG